MSIIGRPLIIGSSGGSSTLITKNITANGTYNASSDNADGYSSVTVNVAGPPIVTGTFTGTTTGAAMEVTIPYTGSGYPVAIMVSPSGGRDGNPQDFKNTLHRYAICHYVLIKHDWLTQPAYTGATNASTDTSYGYYTYKSSTSNATTMSGSTNQNIYNYNDVSAESGTSKCLRFRSPTKMSVYISDTSYGFLANVEYTYVILYSS